MASDEQYLKGLYEDPKSAAAFSGVNQLYGEVKRQGERNISRNRIRKWLEKQAIYTRNRRAVRKFTRRRTIIPYKGYMYDADNAYMNDYTKHNKGYKYFLLLIDNFSKFVWTRPLKKLDGVHIKDALKSIFKDTNQLPERLRTDKGREFRNTIVDKYLNSKNIKHILTQNETQSAFSERAIGTLKGRLLKYMVQNNTRKWIDALPDITQGYNNAYHRSIGKAPANVRKADEVDIWNRLYLPRERKRKIDRYGVQTAKYHFDVGDTVLVRLLKKNFTRGVDAKWSEEPFTVSERFMRQGVPVYRVKDKSNKEITGTWYSPELQKVNPQPDQVYRIEKVLKQRTRNGEKQLLVRWLGFNKDYDSWIPESNLQSYK